MKTWPWIVGGVLLIGFLKRNEIMQVVWDAVTEKRIKDLHPAIRDRARMFINEADRQGIKLRITAGKRTFSEQNELYAQGRTKPGQVVTNAKGGESFHNYALAIDVVALRDGKGIWDANDPVWQKIGAIGKSFGFEWGGEWSGFKDLPHFQYPPGAKVSQLLAMVNAKQVDANGYLTSIAA
jgi:peptidoglycan L-alanyl-D-glutamate endopeptidase CwlK